MGLSNRPLEDSLMPNFDDKTLARFWSKVDRKGPDECWLWTGQIGTNGYGKFTMKMPDNKSPHRSSHQVSYEIECGDRNGLYVLHKCDVPACVNPKHLWLGTQKQNLQDMFNKQRHAIIIIRGEAQKNSKLTVTLVKSLRSLRIAGMTYKKLSEKFSISPSLARKVCVREIWKWVE